MPTTLISIREAAERTGFTTEHVRRLVRAGELEGYRRGKKLIFVDPEQVDALTSRITK